MNPKGIVWTAGEALAARGIDTGTITEGRGALGWLVDDYGQELREEPRENFSPKVVWSAQRVGTSKAGHFRLNSGLALSPCHTRILWIG